ncbi:integrin alpha [Rhodovulum sp. DZ06]|uniref:integrin alpha n=1 Tax=Rhodovulum sp. DZ06 TaxID=3425126 RepID=UPI003D341598
MTFFPQVFDINTLNGLNGFTLEGIDPNYASGVNSGWSVSSAGDMNGDGIDDFVVGVRDQAWGPAGSSVNYGAGALYVVFGSQAGVPSNFNPFSFDGSNGFVVSGVRNNLGLGTSVDAIGDFNEDGYDDIVVGTVAFSAGYAVPGEAFVLFGRPDGGFAPEVDINALAPGQGFRALDSNPGIPGQLGVEVAGIGDFNNDGVPDVAITEHKAYNPWNVGTGSSGEEGAVHILFGGAGNVPMTAPTPGATPVVYPYSHTGVPGPSSSSSLSWFGPIEHGGMATRVAGGDFNGDGADDMIMTAPGAPFRTPSQYNVYITFGGTFPAPTRAVASPITSSPGMAINIGHPDMIVGSVGDVNGDGFDDFLVGMYSSPNTPEGVGSVALVYGSADLGSQPIDIYGLDGTDGIEILGPGNFGIAVDGAGDVNDDGYADIIIGSAGLTPGGAGNPDIFNAAFVLFGGPTGTIGGTAHSNGDFSVNDINGVNGFMVSGTSPFSPSNADALGWSASGAGDVNGDGVDDIIIGAPQATPAPGDSFLAHAGRTYVVYGKSVAAPPPPEILEAGTLQLTTAPQTITLNRAFDNPVAFAFVATENGADPVNARIIDVDGATLTLRLQEPDHMDGGHGAETVHYLVVEAGSWLLPDGTMLEAGTLDTARLSSAGFESVSFDAGFDAAPVVLSQVQSVNGASFITTRMQNKTATGIEIAMQEEEAQNPGGHAPETVGWLAIDAGAGSLGGFSWHAGTVAGVGHDGGTGAVSFPAAGVLAGISSFNGPDTAWSRGAGLTSADFTVSAEEDRSFDAETGHGGEDVDYIAFDGASLGLAGAPLRAILETGSLSLTNAAQTVALGRAFDNPVAFAFVASDNGAQAVNVRITEVSGATLTLRLQEPNHLDGGHGPEDVHFVVAEAGSWILADGSRLEVGTLESGLLTSSGFESVSFGGAFDDTPAVLAQVQTMNGADFVTTRMRGRDAAGVELAMQEEEALNGGGHASETIGWMAIERGTATVGGVSWQAGSFGGVSDAGGCTPFDFAPSGAVVGLSSYVGADPAWARGEWVGTGGMGVRAEEDRSADAEVLHAAETADFFAFSAPGLMLGYDASLFA